jgi:hypothetical protein
MAAAKFTSRERLDVYRDIFLLNRSFHFIGLTQEIQLEINMLLLDRLHSAEERDWAEFGKVRIALEKRLKSSR